MIKCLIVDDEEINRYLLDVLLRDYGYETMNAKNGEEALSMAHANPPDIIITDLLMPIMDGFSLCKALKEDQQLKHVPVVIYTATYTDTRDEAFALSLGADRFLIKPQEPDILLAELNKILAVTHDKSVISTGGAKGEDEFHLKHYEAVSRKLEDKIEQLEQLNVRLAEEIEERKKTQADLEREKEALRESENKYRGILENMDEAYYEVDLGGNLVFFNQALASGIGYSREELMGMNYKQYMSPESWAHVPEIFTDVLNTGKPVRLFEYEIIRKDGDKRNIQSWANLMLDGDNRPIGFRGMGRDVTAQKQAEAEIRILNEELEQRIKERTAQLEAANKELEAFSYSVSHDLRAPLRSIDGFSAALLDDYGGKLDKQAQDYLERIRNAAQRMGDLIENLLKLSRLTRSEFQYRAVDLSAMIKNIAETLQKNNPERVVDLIIQDGVSVRGDANLLRIAMANLMDNSWKFTGRTDHPRIEYGVVVKDGKKVHFIRDNGAGFDMAYTGKLFGAFQRLHRADDFPGTGIGLATVKRIINRHGGEIWAESDSGKGATFFFTI